MRKLLISIALILLLNLPVYAADSQIVTVQPSSFFLKLKQDETRQNYISVRNNSDQKQEIELEAIPIEVSDSYGHIKVADSNKWSLEEWVVFEQKKYILEPNQSTKIPFEVTVPATAVEGSYSGAITINSKSGKTNIVKGTVLYVNIGSTGKTQLVMQDLRTEGDSLNIRINNTGSHMTQVHGNVTWTSLFGKDIGQDKLDPIVIAPGRETSLFVSYKDKFPGVYKADVDVYYANSTKRLRKQINVIHIPLAVPLMVGLGIGGGLLIFHKYRKKHEKKHK